MLVLTQKQYNSFYLLDEDRNIIAEVKLLEIRDKKIVVGIDAEQNITILRKEVYDRIEETKTPT